MKILITGANGFVGRALCTQLEKAGNQIVPGVRRASGIPGERVVGDIHGKTHWAPALEGCQTVVHLAARVHVMKDAATDPLKAFRRTNRDGTLNLARQAATAGVRRFVFISSIKVNGESTQPGRPYGEYDAPAPQDAYGLSKSEAEQGLQALARETGMDVVIIRPPLVYGPKVKANFATMIRWIRTGIPLPLGAIHNQRSFVALDNLIDLITVCLAHPKAANQIFMVSDGEDLSTTALLRGLADAMGLPLRLLPLPQPWIEIGLRLLGREDWVQRLCGCLQVDISHTCSTLGWRPPVSVAEGMRRTAME